MNNVLYEQIMSLLGLIALWALWFYLLKPQRVDRFRQQLFDLRSDLFDLAADGVVPFDHPGYTKLRLLINGMIRFAHRASLGSLVVAAAQAKNAPSSALAEWKKNVEGLPEDARTRLNSIHSRLSEAFVRHLVNGSAILFICSLLRVAELLLKAIFLIITGHRSLSQLTVASARYKVARAQSDLTKPGADIIEARVLFEEQRRTSVKERRAYA
jgi:hypothetical protein